MSSLSPYLLEEGFQFSGISPSGQDEMRKEKDKWLEQPARQAQQIHIKQPQRGQEERNESRREVSMGESSRAIERGVNRVFSWVGSH